MIPPVSLLKLGLLRPAIIRLPVLADLCLDKLKRGTAFPTGAGSGGRMKLAHANWARVAKRKPRISSNNYVHSPVAVTRLRASLRREVKSRSKRCRICRLQVTDWIRGTLALAMFQKQME